MKVKLPTKEQIKQWVTPTLLRMGLTFVSHEKAHMEALRKHHKWQQNNIQAGHECEIEKLSEYIHRNEYLVLRPFREGRTMCSERIGYTVMLDERVFFGLRPGDPQMEDYLAHMFTRACVELVRTGSRRVREYEDARMFRPTHYTRP